MTEDSRPSPLDLVTYLPYACNQLEAPFNIFVTTRMHEDYIQIDKGKKKTEKPNNTSEAQVSSSGMRNDGTRLPKNTNDGMTLLVAIVLDAQGRAVELELQNTIVPIFFLKIVALCISFHPYLNKITLKSCPVNETSIKEISNIVLKSYVTEICLDETQMTLCNCALLLQLPNRLIRLSLNSCGLTDEDCEDIAACLHHRRPAASCLLLLSLAANFITDRGAAALAIMLRSNRRLRYLNIADNQITDTGAVSIFNNLIEFPLTQNEIYTKRLHNLEYSKLYHDVYTYYYEAAITSHTAKIFDDRSGGRKKAAVKHSNISLAVNLGPAAMAEIVASANAATIDHIGPNDDPFNATDTRYQDGLWYSIGNRSLVNINISYNHLSYISVLKLLEVLRYQDNTGSGLVRVMVEGNPLPAASSALSQLAELQRNVVGRRERAVLGKIERRLTRKR